MRQPEKNPELCTLNHVLCPRLDVTDSSSIRLAINEALNHFGKIDVLVNNAGYAAVGPLEAFSSEQIQRQFATNVLGLIETITALIPHFRSQGSGIIINVASVGGRIAFPFYSLYNSTKWAVEGLSEALQHELHQFNIRIKIIEPGPINSDFHSRSADSGDNLITEIYGIVGQKMMANMRFFSEKFGAAPEKTARAIYRAATDNSSRLRYSGGGYASVLLFLRWLLPDRIVNGIGRMLMSKFNKNIDQD